MKCFTISLSCLLMSVILFISPTYANDSHSIEIFSSNNSSEIDIHTAYERMVGLKQHQLKDDIINILQNKHFEQGKFVDVLGTYRMSNDQHITADNTSIFYTSPYQTLSNQQVFDLAQQLAITLQQESIAVFIPNNQKSVTDLSVIFVTHQPKINEIINILHNKLPNTYNQAFSLHLAYQSTNFKNARVTKVEWLGSKINIDEIKKAFPNEQVSDENGSAYLVYKNGQVNPL